MKFQTNNGRIVSFWHDIWFGDKPLCQEYPILYELCDERDSSVYQVQQKGWVVGFRSHLPNILRAQWYELADRLNHVVLSGGQGMAIWKWSPLNKFIVKLVYAQLTKNDASPTFKSI
jgi:hypothetical protein